MLRYRGFIVRRRVFVPRVIAANGYSHGFLVGPLVSGRSFYGFDPAGYKRGAGICVAATPLPQPISLKAKLLGQFGQDGVDFAIQQTQFFANHVRAVGKGMVAAVVPVQADVGFHDGQRGLGVGFFVE